ncbi:hypothetical protein [Kineobactrum salinum]|uniref:Uncharacterized protein n=1 Tax=Kineobactrum salinum TaxID=2708301 RepID=A0A6C0U3B3_9GAMM|nr:hypothetical protein [Kineobactrum salinum]QIB65929.1 hypothetical protein G3T16_11360 [Kineobactrum salinum]
MKGNTGKPSAAVAAFLLWISAAQGAFAETAVEALADLSHQIVWVSSFGSWSNAGSQGVHRVILLDAQADYPHSKIYLQWVEKAGAGQAEDSGRVLASIPVTEINNAAVFQLSLPRVAETGDGNVLELTARNQYSQTVQYLQLLPGAPGHYHLNYMSSPYPASLDSTVVEIPLSLDYYVRPTF